MLNEIRTFFDHSRHTVAVDGQSALLDVLAFSGTEALSETFCYAIEVTSPNLDIVADTMLGKDASFSLRAAPPSLKILGYTLPVVPPLRTLHGVLTKFRRLSASRDEARYELTLEPHLALLDRTCQYRIYQNQSVPEVVELILRRHGWRGHNFLIDLGRTYKQHDQLLQYGESDLSYIKRLCAERGIWFSFSMDSRLKIDVVEFHDSPEHYQRDLSLPLRPLSGMEATGQDAVWDLQASHQVVQQLVSTRAYYSRDAGANLDAQADLTRGATTTYGEAYHYADEHYQTLGDPRARGFEDGHAESGVFYAQLAHERYLNDQLRLSGASSDAALAPGLVLKVTGGAPAAFTEGALIVRTHCTAARDRSFEVRFEAIPDGNIAFRPPVPAKPRIAGTVPARITSPQQNDPYSHIDGEGRYRVNFLFDRDAWPAGRESMWLRLARPYAGDTYGLHMPLLAGTEVAVIFEQGDPDRPIIAHALHTNLEPDHVTIHNHKRNVLRTPSNNKIRLDDTREQEHIKVSTEYSGKSQLNLGHLVDAQRQKRGEGFELRTDGWGSLRAGKGIFISADEQTQASGKVLDMAAAISQLQSALSLATSLANAAQSAQCKPGDTASQERLNQALNGLAQPGLLLHAPAGIGLVSPETVCMSSGAESVGILAAHNVDIGSGHDLTGVAEGAISLLASSNGMQLKASNGQVELHAQNADLHALARNQVRIESTEGRVEITAPEELVLHCGGAYIRIKGGNIELGAPGNIYLKAANVQKLGSASLDSPVTRMPAGYAAGYALKNKDQTPKRFSSYRITTAEGKVFNGVTDKDGKTMTVHTLVPGDLDIESTREIKAILKLVITGERVGYTTRRLNGMPYIKQYPAAVVPVFKVNILEINAEHPAGLVTSAFYVTRDDWYNLGPDEQNSYVLLNREFVPENQKQNLYGARWEGVSGKQADIESIVLTRFGKSGLPGLPLRTLTHVDGSKIKRARKTARLADGVKIRLASPIRGGGEDSKDYGCFDFVSDTELYPSPEAAKQAYLKEVDNSAGSLQAWAELVKRVKSATEEKSQKIQVTVEKRSDPDSAAPKAVLPGVEAVVRLVITAQSTGFTIQGLYGKDVNYKFSDAVVVVKTYKVRILEITPSQPSGVEQGSFNVTRDAWYSLGRDGAGKIRLMNREFKPAIASQNLYGTFWIPSYPNKFKVAKSNADALILTRFGERKIPAKPLVTQKHLDGTDIMDKRLNENVATDVMIHIGGTYEVLGYDHVGGSLGCFAFIPDDDIYPTAAAAKLASENDDYDDITSNASWKKKADEIKRLSFQSKRKLEVILEPRNESDIYFPPEVLSE